MRHFLIFRLFSGYHFSEELKLKHFLPLLLLIKQQALIFSKDEVYWLVGWLVTVFMKLKWFKTWKVVSIRSVLEHARGLFYKKALSTTLVQ